MPRTLTLRTAQLPIWVDASVAYASGRLNTDVWGQETGLIREYLAPTTGSGCRQIGSMFTEHAAPPPRGSLGDAIAHSQVALLARITDRAFGFYDLSPGQLFQVEPITAFGSRLSRDRYYFFMPVGHFTVGKAELCKTDERFATPPEVGDQVFLFVTKPSDTEGVLLHVINPGDVVPVGRDERLHLPAQYLGGEAKSAFPGTKAELLERVRGLRGGEVKP